MWVYASDWSYLKTKHTLVRLAFISKRQHSSIPTGLGSARNCIFGLIHVDGPCLYIAGSVVIYFGQWRMHIICLVGSRACCRTLGMLLVKQGGPCSGFLIPSQASTLLHITVRPNDGGTARYSVKLPLWGSSEADTDLCQCWRSDLTGCSHVVRNLHPQ